MNTVCTIVVMEVIKQLTLLVNGFGLKFAVLLYHDESDRLLQVSLLWSIATFASLALVRRG